MLCVYSCSKISGEMTVSTGFVTQLMPWAEARLVAGDPVKNARAILRYALPIQNTSARRIQVGRTQEFFCHQMSHSLCCFNQSTTANSVSQDWSD